MSVTPPQDTPEPSSPADMLGDKPALLLVVETLAEPHYNRVLMEFLRRFIYRHLQQTGHSSSAGIRLPLSFGCLCAWRVEEPVLAAQELRRVLAEDDLLKFCHLAWWDPAEGIFREVHQGQLTHYSRTIGELWPEIVTWNCIGAKQRNEHDAGGGE